MKYYLKIENYYLKTLTKHPFKFHKLKFYKKIVTIF